MTDIPARVAERAATRYVVDENGCHVSTYSCNPKGYARVQWSERGVEFGAFAHRAAWLWYTGRMPPETIDHECRNHACVRREHLRELSVVDNARLNHSHYPLAWACPRNHVDPPRNARGDCMDCKRERDQDYRSSRRAELAAKERERRGRRALAHC